MSALESARVEAKGRAILISVGIVLIALAGIVSLFLSEGYKLTRRSLAKVRAFSDQVVDKLPVGLIASDEQGRVAAFNETAETILAVSSQRILGGTAAGAVPSELWALSERLDRQGAIIEEDLECKAAGRGHLPLRVSAVSLRGQDGTFLGYVFIFRDLTEVRRLQQELERSRRLAALGNLAAGVAHEIRNPLSSIKGFATYFRERFKDEPEDWGTANIMIQEVERLDRVIGQLLEFARPSGLRVRSVHLHDVIKHSLKLVESDARARGVEVTSMVHEDLAPVAMDADRMNQALLNLYLNAIQAMPEGGKLVVEVSRDESLKQTRITVGDTGPGIEPRDLERIFDPYFTTKPNGTGLGLAIVHKIIEAHGGDLEVKSVLSQGTTVTMILPHMEEARDAY
jgi:two-component system sensor histidine kinase HydH